MHMANSSDANGKIRISLGAGESKKDMVKTWNIIKKFWGYGEYGAFFDEISDKDVCEDMDGVYAEADFSGTGRWSFENNVESFGRWIESTDVITDDEKDFLVNKNFSIDYDFADYEPGCGVFYSARMQNGHEKGQPLSTISGETLDEEALEISARNLARYIGYDDYEVADMSMPRSELKEWFLLGATEAEKAKVEAVFDSDEAYQEMVENETGRIFWSYDDIDWDSYIEDFDLQPEEVINEQQTAQITIRKVDSPSELNEGLVYGAFNQFGVPVGRRHRTAEECREEFEKHGFHNIVMPQKNDMERDR